MALIIPQGPSWTFCSDNLASTPTVSPGTTVTAAGSANADGTAVTLLSALAHDAEFLVVCVGSSNATGTTNNRTLLDILIDPAGGTSWASCVDDLIAGGGTAQAGIGVVGAAYHYFFPIWLPAGASIGAQMRCATASKTVQVVAYAFGGNKNPASWTCGQRVTSLGINAASSSGQDHTPGNSGAFSSWADLGATLPYQSIALQTAVGVEASTSVQNRGYNWEFGVASTRIGPRRSHVTGTGESVFIHPTGPIFCELAAGTQLQVRATCDSTAEVTDCAAYVVS